MTLSIEEEYSKLFQNLHEGILIVNSQGIILYSNPAIASILNIPQNSMNNKHLYHELKLIDKSTSNKHLGYLDLISPNNLTYTFDFPTILIDSLNQDHFVEFSIHDMKNFIPEGVNSKEISGFLITICDRSKEYQLQEVLQKNLRLKSLGSILGGFAHDFNNILTAILGNVSLAKLDLPKSTELSKFLTDAEDGIEKAREMTEQLLNFSIEEEGNEVELLKMNKILKEIVNFTLSGSNVSCNFDVADNLWSANLDKSQIHQAIHQVILTAVQAMPIGGKIDIVAKNVEFLPENIEKYQPGNYIQLTFQDQGIGIPEENLPYIFDLFAANPFGGQRIDLSLVKSIIDQHKGYIKVHSELGKGTLITIYLPAEVSVIPEEIKVAVKSKNLSGKILIMDDEEVIRRILSKMLVQLGFTVQTAENGEEAISIYKESLLTKDPFKIVILDLTVRGGMGGLACIKELLKLDPSVKVVASSGYSTDKAIIDPHTYGFATILVKPYKIEGLQDMLVKLLD
ncbi:MAG: ATP-binding protein [Promethearchaeota archaeon]